MNTDVGSIILVENRFMCSDLSKTIDALAEQAEEVVIISGFGSPKTIEALAEHCKKITVVLGMYICAKQQKNTYDAFSRLAKTVSNMDLRYTLCRVHAKIYVFLCGGKPVACLLGSANVSTSGLTDEKNGEVLSGLDRDTFGPVWEYCTDIIDKSISCEEFDYRLIDDDGCYDKKKNSCSANGGFTVLIPLFRENKEGARYVPEKSGLNWGNQGGHPGKKGPMKSYIGIPSKLIDDYPAVFPPNQELKVSQDGKCTRINDVITLLWDDNTKMDGIFSGGGVLRQGRQYPKQLTSGDGGGAILGGYIRQRLGVDEGKVINYADLAEKGMQYIRLTYIQSGIYRMSFCSK